MIGWVWLVGQDRARQRAGQARARHADGWLSVAIAAALAGFVASMWVYDAIVFTQGDFRMHLLIGSTAVLLLMPVAARRGSGPAAVRS